jgi:hypothetical protein
MWRDGSTAQAEFAAKKHNKKQTENDGGIFNFFVLVTQFARGSWRWFTSNPEILPGHER